MQVSGINPDFCYVPGIKIRWESGTGEKVRGTLFKSCHQPRLLYVASYVLLLLSAECTAPRSIKTNIVKRGWPRRQVILSSYYSTRASWQVYARWAATSAKLTIISNYFYFLICCCARFHMRSSNVLQKNARGEGSCPAKKKVAPNGFRAAHDR